MAQHRLDDRVVAQVGIEAELMIGLDRVGTGFLQAVRANLVDEADAPALLSQVQQNAAAFIRNALDRILELRTAIAALAEQGIAGQAFRMQASQHRLAVVDLA